MTCKQASEKDTTVTNETIIPYVCLPATATHRKASLNLRRHGASQQSRLSTEIN
jgi:hypothetical protein